MLNNTLNVITWAFRYHQNFQRFILLNISATEKIYQVDLWQQLTLNLTRTLTLFAERYQFPIYLKKSRSIYKFQDTYYSSS